MTESKYYATDAHHAEKVRELFAAIARRYDLMNDLMSFGLHRRWKRRVAEMIETPNSKRVLDLCCGTGDIALNLVARGARVVGADFTSAMLSLAGLRSQEVRWMSADALRLPFADESFDAVTIGYGLRNLADFEAGLREMLRVTRRACPEQGRRGGCVVILDFGMPDNRLWRAFYLGWLRVAVPTLGWLLTGDRHAYSYILTSLEHYPAQRGIAELMRQVGFTDIRVENLLGGVSSIHVGER